MRAAPEFETAYDDLMSVNQARQLNGYVFSTAAWSFNLSRLGHVGCPRCETSHFREVQTYPYLPTYARI